MGRRLPAAILAVLVAVELLAILIGNGGKLTYTLDDAYIHLALAESIAVGEYGVNPGEAAAPSSSILWPFLLAPVARLPAGELLPLLLNAAATFAALAVYARCLALLGASFAPGSPAHTALLLLLIPATNLVGLLFTGMEHSLHLLVTALTVLALLREATDGRPPRWLWAVLWLQPLVRYEGMAVTVPVLLYLFLRGHRRGVLLNGAAVTAAVGAFTFFLTSLGLLPLPASLTVKSLVLSRGPGFATLADNLATNLSRMHGDILGLALVVLAAAGLRRGRPRHERWLAWSAASGVLLHLVFGRMDWYHRYEVYIWVFAVLLGLFLFRDLVTKAVEAHGVFRAAVVVALFIAVGCRGYLHALVTTPAAASNIYEQQYQMHRFASEFLRGPVAVNDLGWVAFRNEHDVMDVVGLGSPDVLKARQRSADLSWLDPLVREHRASCAMLYKDWYPRVPPGWVELAELTLRGAKVTAAHETVTIYATGPANVVPLLQRLALWQETLPDPAMLEITFVPGSG